MIYRITCSNIIRYLHIHALEVHTWERVFITLNERLGGGGGVTWKMNDVEKRKGGGERRKDLQHEVKDWWELRQKRGCKREYVYLCVYVCVRPSAGWTWSVQRWIHVSSCGRWSSCSLYWLNTWTSPGPADTTHTPLLNTNTEYWKVSLIYTTVPATRYQQPQFSNISAR